ncbi:MAG TPA: response regulator [Thermoanaerobaculia bacterium]|nr:response regulator [Thermoanaerobaculia bacterium]
MVQQTILVVDDDEHIRGLEAKVLEREGYRVDQATDGREAIERLDADGYAALVLDLMMPRTNGFDVIEHLARTNPLMISKTVIATAFPREAGSAGLQEVCCVIVKPFDIHQLVDAVDACAK